VSPAGPDTETPPVAAITTAAVAVPGETALAKPGTAVMAVPSCAACESSNALTETLRKAAERHNDAKAFDIYAAALEIDSIQKAPFQRTIAESLREHWEAMTGDRRTLEEAKLGLVLRFGEALREVARRGHCQPAYNELFDIGCMEESYPVRLAIAQEIGSGGDKAFTALCRGLRDPLVVYHAKMRKPPGSAPNSRPGGVRSSGVTKAGAEPQAPQGVEDVSPTERARRSSREEKNAARARIWREFVLRAWMAPMLAGSVSDACRDDAQWHLEVWLKHLKPQSSRPGRADLPLSLEIALAQGFKSAANRRKHNPCISEEASVYLVRQAEEMLKYSRYWFTQLTLIHALCLWALPDERDTSIAGRAPGKSGFADGQEPDKTRTARRRHRGTGPAATVARWLTMAGSRCAPADQHAADKPGQDQLHPFVAEAGDLAALALECGSPVRFIWIDESGIVRKVGSRPASPRDYRKHNLWIAPSSGWSALDRRAQQLVADVLIMLNLTEQAGSTEPPAAREHRLESSNRSTLPPCLTRDRRPLQPGHTIGSAVTARHGSTCLDGCQFELCPYPPSGAQPRAELSEAFCRHQQSLLAHRVRRPGRKTAAWQGLTPKELQSFWAQMAWRSRPPRPEE
jgi:hypothetical protein